MSSLLLLLAAVDVGAAVAAAVVVVVVAAVRSWDPAGNHSLSAGSSTKVRKGETTIAGKRVTRTRATARTMTRPKTTSDDGEAGEIRP